ncbi:helix-turn-helix transcriptional regulator [Nonomuraea longicatena]|uniref:helix-turn-helix domain-containing protein n=1 Tax=Nonomuraea longicatena TaxID=83682 RepID=UPI0031D30A48
MTGGSSSPTAQQRFGRELARVRRDAGLSQKRLAAKLGVSGSLVGHIEIGDRNPKPDLAARCDDVFGSGDRFARLCRAIDSPVGPGWYIQWVDEIEPNAKVLRSWDPMLIPGLLQTESYARAIFQGDLSAPNQEIEEHVQARMQRKMILDRGELEAWFLLDEWVVRRPIGSNQIMADQLEHLVEFAERRNVTIQLVPVDSPCTGGLMSAFTIAELPDGPAVVSVDSAAKAEVSADPDLVSRSWIRYDKLRSEAYRPGETLKMIKEAIGQWMHKT